MRPVTISGVTYPSMSAAADAHGLNYQTFVGRIKRYGWSPDDSASRPLQHPTVYTIDGVTDYATNWARKYNQSPVSVIKRLQRGQDILTALTARRRRATLTPAERAANRARMKVERDARLRAHIRALKSFPCTDCHRVYHTDAMEFDHCRGEKHKDVSRLTTFAAVEREIAKCDLVCANCHRVRSHARRSRP